MEAALYFYKFRNYLTLHEAVCLASGVDPESESLPDGYHGLMNYIAESIAHDLYLIKKNGLSLIQDPTTRYSLSDDLPGRVCDLIGVTFGAYITRKHAHERIDFSTETRIKIDATTKVKTSELISWFESKSLKPSFFFEESPSRTLIPSDISRPKYRTKLMKIIDRTVERYYGENFDINDPDSYPSQQEIVGWLEREFSLTTPEARSVERVITHRGDNYPKGKTQRYTKT